MSEFVRAEQRGALGILILDRPKALNALTADMCIAIDAQLTSWDADPAVQVVIIQGADEKAYCAGGDVRAMYHVGRSGGDAAEFDRMFRCEYRMNYRLARMNTPVAALVDGIAMGGGLGVSVYAQYRIVTETTMMAMPEVGIGLFPDIGATWFLHQAPGFLGLWLALTGARIGAAEALLARLGTHFVPRGDLGALVSLLEQTPDQVASVLNRFKGTPPAATLDSAAWSTINRCFGWDGLNACLDRLAAEPGPWAAKQWAAIRAGSPTSVRITYEALKRSRGETLDQVLMREFRMSQACMTGHDFFEGIRAQLIDKDHSPQWLPATLAEVDDALVERHFQPVAQGELSLL
jgi:enoyl-CoA hydratase